MDNEGQSLCLTERPKPSPPRIHRGRRFFWLFLPVLLLVFTALTVFRPRAHELQTYVSPPLDAKGTRVSVRYPAGWTLQRVTLSTARNPAAVSITIGPPAWPLWVPDWLTRWRAESLAYMHLIARRVPHREAKTLPGQVVLGGIGPRGPRIWRAIREQVDSGWSLYLYYSRTDQAAFDRTQQAIRDSLRVRPGSAGTAP